MQEKRANTQLANPTAMMKASIHIWEGLTPSNQTLRRPHLSHYCTENEGSHTVAYAGHTQTIAHTEDIITGFSLVRLVSL